MEHGFLANVSFSEPKCPKDPLLSNDGSYRWKRTKCHCIDRIPFSTVYDTCRIAQFQGLPHEKIFLLWWKGIYFFSIYICLKGPTVTGENLSTDAWIYMIQDRIPNHLGHVGRKSRLLKIYKRLYFLGLLKIDFY